MTGEREKARTPSRRQVATAAEKTRQGGPELFGGEGEAGPDLAGPDAGSDGEEYLELSRLVKARGLLEKQPGYYAANSLVTLASLGLGFTVLALAEALWLRLLDASFLALVFSRIAFLGHDAGHRQIFRSNRANDLFGLLIALLMGIERTWWVEKHNRHHSSPNQLGKDPDIDIPVLAFTKGQALAKRGLYRWTTRYQPYLFYPLLSLEGGGGLRLAGLQYMLRHQLKYPVAEPLLMAGHFAVYLGLVFWLLEPWHAGLFIAVHQLLFGLHMGLVFAPNHKGMPILDQDCPLDYLRRQVLTARNVWSNPVVDFLYGGLNYQIEHHLFPSMPRNRLGQARDTVRAFCLARSIPYHETGVLGSQREILGCLRRASAPLRGKTG